MNHEEAIRRLQQYHAGEKVKAQVGIGYIAAPEPMPPKPIAPNPLTIAQTQIAESYWQWAQALKNL